MVTISMTHAEFINKWACGCDFGGARLPEPHYAIECCPQAYDRAEFDRDREARDVMCGCGHTRTSHRPGECVGCLGECDVPRRR